MDALDRIAWRAVLRELKDLEAELDRVSRKITERCAPEDARDRPQPLINLQDNR